MEESRVCPICDTANPGDAIHCEVCGERLIPEENDGADAADELSSDGGEVVGFAIDDSNASEGDVEFSAAGQSEADVTTDTINSIDDDEGDAPALNTEEMDAPGTEEIEIDDVVEAVEVADVDPPTPPEGVPSVDGIEALEVSEGESEPMDEKALQAEFEALEEEYADPDFLYSPMDGTAYPRGSAEYEEGFGPNGEQLVATAPDIAEATYVSEGQDLSAPEETALNEQSGASMGDAELAAAAAPSSTVSAEFQNAFKGERKARPTMAPLPQPGTYMDPAVLTVYANREPVMRLAIDMDEVLIGRRDPVADAYPDLDLTDLDPQAHLSRKHAYIYRQNKNYTLYAVTNAGTQLNSDLLELGDRRALKHGDVIVLAGKIAMKFELPNN